LSVDIVGRDRSGQQIGMNSGSVRNANYKKQVRDYSLRMSRINEDKLADLKNKSGIDMHELSVNHGVGNHQHSKSLMKANPLGSPLDEFNQSQHNIIDKKKEILERKRYE